MPHNNQVEVKDKSVHTRKKATLLLATGKLSDLFSDNFFVLQMMERGKARTILSNGIS